MRIAHPEMDFYIESEENKADVLVIENRAYLYRFVTELEEQLETKVGQFVLSDGDILPLEKNLFLITDLFHLDFAKKKILSKIYSELNDIACDGEYYDKTAAVLSQLEAYIDGLVGQCDTELEYSLPSSDGLLKLFGVRVSEHADSLLEKLVDYLRLINSTFNIRYFVIYGLHSLLTKEELIEFYRFAFLKKYVILSVEAYGTDCLECERQYIIDADLCSVLQ